MRINILPIAKLAASSASLFFIISANETSASLADDSTDIGGGWMSSPWFGEYYVADGGWIYSPEWGWDYECDAGTDASWLYATDESCWYWTCGDFYPYLYRYGDPGWIRYYDDSTNPRAYYSYANASWEASDGTDGAIWKRYYDAIVDAETAEYGEICYDLTAINQYNDDLPWNDSHTAIIVASWVKAKYVSSYVAGEDLTPTWEIWVTVAGQARDFAQSTGLSGDELALRMRQLIGLSPDAQYDYWVEFYVSPDDLYRPSADPDPSDCEAELDFATGDEESVSEDYIEWFEAYAASSYVLSRKGFPWTRLGYTYDWGSDTTEVGLSEFVIRTGSTVKVGGVYPNDEYLESE